ncbi:MAG: peptidase M48 family protein [Sphingomonas sp.]
MAMQWIAVIGAGAMLAPGLAEGLDRAPSAALLELLRRDDLRLATVGYRLITRNAALCDVVQPALGIQFHTLAQYQPAARGTVRAVFNFRMPIAVEGVVTGAPAESAGVLADDGVVSIAGQPLATALLADESVATTRDIEAVEAVVAKLPPTAPVAMVVQRADHDVALSILPTPACRARFEVSPESGASSDGYVIQIGADYLDKLSDAELAVVVAHELAHNILRHRPRLEAAGAHFGVLSEFGKSGRVQRQAETEADLMSVYVLANAGYDPLNAGRFWRGAGRQFDAGIFRNRAYRSPSARATLLDAEAAKISGGAALPIMPALLESRNKPLK